MRNEMRQAPRRYWAAFGLAALVLAGCSSTQLTDSWASPDAAPLTFRKILVVCLCPDRVTRRTAEDAFVQHMWPAQAAASYTLISDADLRDEAKVQAQMAAAGYDGAVTLRIVSREQQLSWVPGAYPPYYGSFGGYYDWAWPGAYDPGYMRIDDVVQIETNIYAVKGGDLIWGGVSETVNPASISKAIAEVAEAAAKDLRKRGLIPPAVE